MIYPVSAQSMILVPPGQRFVYGQGVNRLSEESVHDILSEHAFVDPSQVFGKPLRDLNGARLCRNRRRLCRRRGLAFLPSFFLVPLRHSASPAFRMRS